MIREPLLLWNLLQLTRYLDMLFLKLIFRFGFEHGLVYSPWTLGKMCHVDIHFTFLKKGWNKEVPGIANWGEIAYASAVFFEACSFLLGYDPHQQRSFNNLSGKRMLKAYEMMWQIKQRSLSSLKLTVRTRKHGIPKGKDRPPTSNHQFSGALAVSFRERVSTGEQDFLHSTERKIDEGLNELVPPPMDGKNNKFPLLAEEQVDNYAGMFLKDKTTET